MIALLLSGCGTTGKANLYDGELWVSKHNNIEQALTVDEDEIFKITIYFR